jgi:hypothetical protein
MSIGFHFELRPLADLSPWTTPEGRPSLSWYALSDGWYDIELDGRTVFDGPLPYDVVRLWEDLIGLAPYALRPIRDDAVARFDQAETEARVVSVRTLTSDHFVGLPVVRFWTHGGATHVRKAMEPRVTLPTPAFVAALRDLDRRFIAAMGERVATILSGRWKPPGVAIDRDNLQHEHADRATWLQKALDTAVDED